MLATFPALLTLLVLDPKLRKARYVAALLMYAVMVGIGSIPGARAEIGHFASGIVLHTLGYATLTFLLFTGSTGSHAARAGRAILTVLVMGAVDELIQSFLPYRHGAFSDWLVDANAAVLCAGLLWAFLPAPSAVK